MVYPRVVFRGPRSLEALQKICSAFDVGLQIQLVSFSDMVRDDKEFAAPTFSARKFSEDYHPLADNFLPRISKDF